MHWRPGVHEIMRLIPNNLIRAPPTVQFSRWKTPTTKSRTPVSWMAGNRAVKKRPGGERCAGDRAEDEDSFAPWTLLRSLA